MALEVIRGCRWECVYRWGNNPFRTMISLYTFNVKCYQTIFINLNKLSNWNTLNLPVTSFFVTVPVVFTLGLHITLILRIWMTLILNWMRKVYRWREMTDKITEKGFKEGVKGVALEVREGKWGVYRWDDKIARQENGSSNEIKEKGR